MIIQIALGIVLGYIIIKALPDLRDITENVLNWIFDKIAVVFKFLYRCWEWLDHAAWYYKLGVFILVSFILLGYNLVECWGWFAFLYTYFPARWICNLFNKQK